MRAYEIRGLCKTYPRQEVAANRDIDLDIEAGEIFVLIGDNGSGKTTLVKQMAHLLRPSEGRIRLFGKALDASPLYTPSLIGFMPQGGNALDDLTLSEALYFADHLRGLSRRDARAERDRLVEELGMGAFRDRVIARLSGGQRRLAALATTLAGSPPILILDEPTNDLDPQYRQRVWEILQTVARDTGATIILVTHNLVEVEKLVQRVAVLSAGRVVAQGRPGALKQSMDRQLRLHLAFDPDHPPELPADIPVREAGRGRWNLRLDRERAGALLPDLLASEAIEDFHLSTETLEDFYLWITENP